MEVYQVEFMTTHCISVQPTICVHGEVRTTDGSVHREVRQTCDSVHGEV